MKNFLHIVEAIIFAAGMPIRREEILAKLPERVPPRVLNETIDKLTEIYSGDCGIRLEIFNDSVQFSSNAQYGEIVAEVLQPVKEKELSKILLEVLAIIAYKQPITRGEIEDIRGVSPDYALNVLTKVNLIYPCGFKKAPGKPVQYATTDEFLKKFELRTLDELPDYGEVMRRLVEFGNFNVQTGGLYREVDLADDFAEEPTSSAVQQEEEFLNMFREDDDDFLKSDDMVVVEGDAALAAADLDEEEPPHLEEEPESDELGV